MHIVCEGVSFIFNYTKHITELYVCQCLLLELNLRIQHSITLQLYIITCVLKSNLCSIYFTRSAFVDKTALLL